MILTVTPNVALDITYRVDQLTPGSSHRVRGVQERAGGGGSTSPESSTVWATTP
jgi:tagatose 6-phosphate kinase